MCMESNDLHQSNSNIYSHSDLWLKSNVMQNIFCVENRTKTLRHSNKTINKLFIFHAFIFVAFFIILFRQQKKNKNKFRFDSKRKKIQRVHNSVSRKIPSVYILE